MPGEGLSRRDQLWSDGCLSGLLGRHSCAEAGSAHVIALWLPWFIFVNEQLPT